MNDIKLDLNAEIVPDVGLGGLKLRTHLSELENIKEFPWFRPDSYCLVSPFEARYRFSDGKIAAAVDVRNGKVFKLIAYRGYLGKLLGQICVGMSVREAMKIEPRLFYDEAEEVIACKDVPGLTIDIPEIDPPIELVPDLFIHAISVFVTEIRTVSGQEGNW